MKYLVTGGAGFIGSHTVLELVRMGREVIIFDNLETSSQARLQSIEKLTGKTVSFFQGDLRKMDDVRACFDIHKNISAVFHFAAYKFVGESEEHPYKYYENNVIGTAHLLGAMEEFGIDKLIFSSTGGAIYGEPKSVPVSEEHSLEPASVYGHTKLLCEQIIHAFTRTTPLRAIALRYFNAVGADDSGEIGEYIKNALNIVPIAFQVALGERPSIFIFGNDYPTPDGTGIRDYIHVNDLARGHIQALRLLEDGTKWNYFNLGTGRGYSVLEIVEMIKKITGKDLPCKFKPRRVGDIAVSYADVSKARDTLGFEAHYDLENIIQTAWKWYQK